MSDCSSNITRKILSWAFLVFTIIIFAGYGQETKANFIKKGFVEPPDYAKPHVYWLWLENNISRKGITDDLEEMNLWENSG